MKEFVKKQVDELVEALKEDGLEYDYDHLYETISEAFLSEVDSYLRTQLSLEP